MSGNRGFIFGDEWAAGKDLEGTYQTRVMGDKPERDLSEIPGTRANFDALVVPVISGGEREV